MLTIEILGRAYAPEGQHEQICHTYYDLDHLKSQVTGFSVQLRKSYGIEKKGKLNEKEPVLLRRYTFIIYIYRFIRFYII